MVNGRDEAMLFITCIGHNSTKLIFPIHSSCRKSVENLLEAGLGYLVVINSDSFLALLEFLKCISES